MKELNAILQHLRRPGAAEGAVLATLVAVEGSSYRRPGTRLLRTAAGARIGTISGGCLEEDVCARAEAVARGGAPEVAVYDTTSENDLLWGVGTGCHGVVRVLLERLPGRADWIEALAANLAARRPTELAVAWGTPDRAGWGTSLGGGGPAAGVFRETVRPPPALVVFGAGDDAAPLVRGAKELGWHVTVADVRPGLATRERFPEADALVAAPAAELAGRAAPEAGALAVVMTHHYVHDLPLLGDLLPRPLSYLGLLGPRARAERILGDLEKQGRGPSPERRDFLRAPVGFDLGAETPEEVALSILAEMRAVLAGRDGRPLKHRSRPIHDAG